MRRWRIRWRETCGARLYIGHGYRDAIRRAGWCAISYAHQRDVPGNVSNLVRLHWIALTFGCLILRMVPGFGDVPRNVSTCGDHIGAH